MSVLVESDHFAWSWVELEQSSEGLVDFSLFSRFWRVFNFWLLPVLDQTKAFLEAISDDEVADLQSLDHLVKCRVGHLDIVISWQQGEHRGPISTLQKSILDASS